MEQIKWTKTGIGWELAEKAPERGVTKKIKGLEDIVIVDGCRIPIGRFGGSLKNLTVWRLGALAIKGVLARVGLDPELVDEVIMSHTRQDGTGTNPARNMALYAGIPKHVAAHTVNMVCAAGLKAAHLAALSLLTGTADIVIAGGAESMSNIPHLLRGARWKPLGRLNNITIEDGFLYLADNYCGLTAGLTGERAAEIFNQTREENEQVGYESHIKATRGWQEGAFDDEVIPIDVPGNAPIQGGPQHKVGKPAFTFYTDECYRPNPSLELMLKLPPAFKEDGRLSAGNSSGITDGAGAMVITTRKKAKEMGWKPIASFVDFLFYGVDPADFPMGPGVAIPIALKRNDMTLDDLKYVEINEAYSSVILAAEQMLGWKDREKLNPHGGCIALGHPTGYSGARLLIHLAHVLRAGEYGLACLCGGGGIAGVAIVKGEKDLEQFGSFKKVIVGLDETGHTYVREPSPEELEKIKQHEPSEVFKEIRKKEEAKKRGLQ